ncbi:EPIDERMAL PATTERNING FACTOR-like protein 1 isoform X2 [Ricinus communis]|uniref:EPIDERMAL PATTERNING FACTOR-like protein 1 isoform X2 n=1 Tax=Ricinus communis TaxID=3988 RepID=UPI00201B07C7|nr:EPIDERMAL PATTERNING FACTOR-like protein 1 isoform X2 [Ricinus communis]
MRRRMCYFLMATLQMITWYSVAFSWHFVSHDSAPQKVQIPHFPQAAAHDTPQLTEQTYRGLSRLGSRPPSCEHKCESCIPCNAIQIPATTDRKTVQYANYEPEGWKCKCGTTFYNP